MVRFGVVGTNWISDRFIQAAKDHKSFSLTAVYSRTEERARAFADRYKVTDIFTNLEEMAQSSSLDAVYIASPNSFHASQAVTFMKHGKHVLCEKPIASNTRELHHMIQTARQNQVLLMEALKSSFLPGFIAIRENLHKIGKIRRTFASYCQYSSRYDAFKEGQILNAFKPEFSNGSLMDIGIYCIYPMVVLFGKPVHIQANAVMLSSGVDGSGSLMMNYGEMEAIAMYSKISDSYLPAEIQGEEGCMIIDKINQPEKVEIRYRDGRIEDLTQPMDHRDMYYEVKEFIELLEGGQLESKTNSHENSLTAMAILEEARKQIGLVFPADLQESI